MKTRRKKLYLSNDERFDNLSDDLEEDLLDGNTDSILFTDARRTM